MTGRKKHALPIKTKIGRYTLLEYLGRKPHPVSKISYDMIRVQCDCGTIKEINYCNFQGGTTLSCGCYFKEMRGKRGHKRKDAIKYSMVKLVLPTNVNINIPNEPVLKANLEVKKANIWLIEYGLSNGILPLTWISRMNLLTRQILNPKNK